MAPETLPTTSPTASDGATEEEADLSLSSSALDQLNNPEAKTLLDTIDSLRDLHIGDIVSLPQIIVVGDQSSGKSSVLEAISRMPFPVKGELCTRFATELVLRKAPRTSINVSIQFANVSLFDPRPQQGASSASQWSTFDEDALPKIIEEAKERMGIRAGSSKGFSKDILRIEISSPRVYPLTLVDLPGFFHSATADQSQEGKQVVDQLAESYMKQKNSIILAVVSANNQLANQTVLEKAKKHDPGRERTMGVITKPDLPLRGSADEKKFLQLAKGQESMHKLSRGWHVLRNRSEGDESADADARDAAEERFFQTGPWSTLSSRDRGIDSFRKKLATVLLQHIQKCLPSLVSEIESNLESRQTELERLGKARSTPEELRSYLLGISEQYQRIARDGVDGKYSDAFFGGLDQDQMKLRAILRNFNRAFNKTLRLKGSKVSIKWNDADKGSDFVHHMENDDKLDFLEGFLALYDFPDPEPLSEEEVHEELQLCASINQGREFPGSPNAELIMSYFRKQSEPWLGIAERHVNLVTDYSRAFVEQLFRHVIGNDDKTLGAVLCSTADPFFQTARELLKAKLQELFRPYKQGYTLTLDDEFQTLLDDVTVQKLAKRVANVLCDEHAVDANPRGITHKQIEQTLLKSRDIQKSSEFGTEQIIDMTTAYYRMSRQTFTENVINLAVESCLIFNIPDILTFQKVNAMSEDQLRQLAAESEEVLAEREMLQQQAGLLRQALQKCRQYGRREINGMPSTFSNLSPAGTSRRHESGPRSPRPTATANGKTSTAMTNDNGSAVPTPGLFSTASTPAPSPSFSPEATRQPSSSPFGIIPTAPTSGLFGGGLSSTTTPPTGFGSGGLFGGSRASTSNNGSGFSFGNPPPTFGQRS
ncbi:uncharacterized protein E0L32_007597 [Thyridium curvatum]|uniref:Uncharacterized protein n=1 Tax=Thyridium curvatum TaxID=1093900 RepID=A0A507B413_9PEZI|nr:uncharacterized protein E0L32_007597 [Thyridium curvatum]TPX11618.1 hypothetical protein E0L32_007597 [Thyridium curvatum]